MPLDKKSIAATCTAIFGCVAISACSNPAVDLKHFADKIELSLSSSCRINVENYSRYFAYNNELKRVEASFIWARPGTWQVGRHFASMRSLPVIVDGDRRNTSASVSTTSSLVTIYGCPSGFRRNWPEAYGTGRRVSPARSDDR